jgi:2-keto-4-pentenoate hydratase/2-oxohepta-3-ene-1,7-dioic acid hydratase in catechol pathway
MKLVSYEVATVFGPVRRVGGLLDAELNDDARIVDLNSTYGQLLREGGDSRWRQIAEAALPADMLEFLEGGPQAMERAREALRFAADGRSDPDGRRLVFQRNEVRLLAPVPRPRTMRDFSVYEEHMMRRRPDAQKPPSWYHFGTCYKGNPDMVFGPDDPLRWPDYSDMLDPELELAAVLFKQGMNLSPEEAQGCIAGYTIFVDGSARDISVKEMLGPYKHKDFGTNLGPCLVTPDEFDEMDARCGIRVNGEEWWQGNTGQQRNFRMRDIIAYASDEELLQPGDVIAAGTIADSCSVDTGRWINPGDVVEMWIEGIGSMRLSAKREKRELSYVRDGMEGLLPVPEHAQEYPQKLKDGRVENPLAQRGR